jgi:hypothetical protein
MRKWLQGLLLAFVIGVVALLLVNAAALMFPAGEHAVTLTIVIAGTVLLVSLRWGIWPFRRRDSGQKPELIQLHGPAEPERRRRIQLIVVVSLLGALLLTWALAAIAWTSYDDAESRSFVLRGLARTSAVVVSAAVLVMPPLRRGVQQSKYQAVLVVLLASGWLAGTVLLPSICRALADACYSIEQFVLAIPGWSLVPVAALLVRSVGAQAGVASWRSFE